MKFLHMADLHIGKIVNGYRMIEDQEYILKEILEIAKNEKVDAVLMAGDIYDRSIAPEEAVNLFNRFLEKLRALSVKIFIVSGNHDSAERIAFAGELLKESGVYISYPYDGTVRKHTLSDEYGNINIYLIPFVKPISVRRALEDENIITYTDSMKALIENLSINKNERNIAISHQYITGGKKSESEEISIGGLDNIDYYVYEDFDYTALGHLHGAQRCGSDNIRYAGSILKYAFTEHKKSVTIIEMKEKNNLKIDKIELKPQRELRVIEGEFEEIIKNSYKDSNSHDYVSIVLKDEMDIPNAYYRLKDRYKNIMSLSYDNTRTKNKGNISSKIRREDKSPVEYCRELFEEQNGKSLSENQERMLKEVFEKIMEENV